MHFSTMRSFITLLAISLGWTVNNAYCFIPVVVQSPDCSSIPKSITSSTICRNLAPSEDAAGDADATRLKIESLIEANPVVLFMKGTKFFPQCGFSDTATKILEALEVDQYYEAVNVLADDSIREGIKDYSQWPTIPQLYVNQEFIGGSDIMLEMYENGELKEIIEEAKAQAQARKPSGRNADLLDEKEVEMVLDGVRPFVKVGGGSLELNRIEGDTIYLEMKGKAAALQSIRSEIAQRLQRHFQKDLTVQWIEEE